MRLGTWAAPSRVSSRKHLRTWNSWSLTTAPQTARRRWSPSSRTTHAFATCGSPIKDQVLHATAGSRQLGDAGSPSWIQMIAGPRTRSDANSTLPPGTRMPGSCTLRLYRRLRMVSGRRPAASTNRALPAATPPGQQDYRKCLVCHGAARCARKGGAFQPRIAVCGGLGCMASRRGYVSTRVRPGTNSDSHEPRRQSRKRSRPSACLAPPCAGSSSC